ncbi:protein phosphatase methylesterase 1 isoform X1 [Selaginella moellendorffii]|uniref:protein phosphatase methylesterase 1 isoform X1 n=1 Tax=Selaginella moellendorffii TaxID=88036 RepID=UPI000D1C7ACE|nr:protein phosphatase methylesterase 1 isoform X1 [Selaginella moellendorffii]|eukprot:XP_024536042.1 protein phosphatase methylesterase 1 isoform X1 [Selaginella moellendorffii]
MADAAAMAPVIGEEDQSPGGAGTSGIPTWGSSRSKFGALPWTDYFDEELDVEIGQDSFHVYLAGTQGPVLFCLHGGGSSGLSFALSARMLKEKVKVAAMDMRGHGSTRTSDDLDLSAETLCQDVLDVIRTMYKNDPPSIVLIGHSMGGAIATRVAAKRVLRTLAGLIVVDVVEGTAIASLIHMQKLLSNRPPAFPSVEKAIEWNVKGGSLRNIDSARVSIPPTLKYNEERKCYVWLTPLEKSERHWRGWYLHFCTNTVSIFEEIILLCRYEGLSDIFLSAPVAKVLLLAGTDRLDKSLTIGQMQGKFQMIVVRHTGHAIQEDVPEEFSSLVLTFVARNRIGAHGIDIPGLIRQRRSA